MSPARTCRLVFSPRGCFLFPGSRRLLLLVCLFSTVADNGRKEIARKLWKLPKLVDRSNGSESGQRFDVPRPCWLTIAKIEEFYYVCCKVTEASTYSAWNGRSELLDIQETRNSHEMKHLFQTVSTRHSRKKYIFPLQEQSMVEKRGAKIESVDCWLPEAMVTCDSVFFLRAFTSETAHRFRRVAVHRYITLPAIIQSR